MSQILSVDPPPIGHGPVELSQSFDARYRGPQPGAATSAVVEPPATVKFFEPAKEFGVVCGATNRVALVLPHSALLPIVDCVASSQCSPAFRLGPTWRFREPAVDVRNRLAATTVIVSGGGKPVCR